MTDKQKRVVDELVEWDRWLPKRECIVDDRFIWEQPHPLSFVLWDAWTLIQEMAAELEETNKELVKVTRERDAAVVKVNYDHILWAGMDYYNAKHEYMPVYPSGYDLTPLTLENLHKYTLCSQFKNSEAVLRAVAQVTGIPKDVIVRAARVVFEYFDRGGDHDLDAKQLITGLLKNS